MGAGGSGRPLPGDHVLFAFDAKYVANLARTASFYGAHVATRLKVEGFVKVGQRVVGAKVHDLETDEHFEIRIAAPGK